MSCTKQTMIMETIATKEPTPYCHHSNKDQIKEKTKQKPFDCLK
jgi:hypothetical protein